MRLFVIGFGILAVPICLAHQARGTYAAGLAQTLSLTAAAQSPLRAESTAPVAGYSVQQAYPHDSTAFTQGLEYLNGDLYESTGLNGRSSIRKVKLETGAVLQQRAISRDYFGEGLTIWKSTLIELTWQSQVAFVYDRDTFEPRRMFSS